MYEDPGDFGSETAVTHIGQTNSRPPMEKPPLEKLGEKFEQKHPSKTFADWLGKPNHKYYGKTPQEMIDTGKLDDVLSYLDGIVS